MVCAPGDDTPNPLHTIKKESPMKRFDLGKFCWTAVAAAVVMAVGPAGARAGGSADQASADERWKSTPEYQEWLKDTGQR